VASGATAANYVITHANGTLTVTPAFSVKINFQPASPPVPPGYLPDTGAVFANRGNGYSYGWNGNNSGSMKDRNSSLSPDQRYDTLAIIQKAGRIWEIAVPNGSYDVFVVAGDAANFNSAYRLAVEGTLTVSGTPTSSTRWISGAQTVTVTDGRLTLSNAPGDNNNSVCFIEITATAPAIAAAPLLLTQGPLTLQWIGRGADDQITLRVEGATPGAQCVIESSSDLMTWDHLAVTTTLGGTLTFSDPGAAGQTQRFYRVRVAP
jgi:hypothetical protein